MPAANRFVARTLLRAIQLNPTSHFPHLLHGVDHDETIDAITGADPQIALLASSLGRLDDGDAVEAATLDLSVVDGRCWSHHRHRLDEEGDPRDGPLFPLRHVPGGGVVTWGRGGGKRMREIGRVKGLR